MTDSKLNKLRTQRAVVIDQQERVKEFVETQGTTANLAQLELRLQFLEKHMDSFSSLQSSMEAMDDTELVSNQRASFEETYFTVQPALVTLIQQKKRLEVPDSSPHNESPQRTIRLPKISLPTFSGDITEWLSFYETFKTLVHNDSSLSNIQKFQYLRSTLSGNASKQIQSLELTDENYSIAIQILCERYDNKKCIIQAHIQSLLDIRQLDHTKPSKIRELIDKTNVHLRALESLQRPVKQWDDLIVFSIVSKLDPTLRMGWERESPQDRLPTLKELLTYLNKQYLITEATSKQVKVEPPVTPAKSVRASFKSFITTSCDTCAICKSRHFIYKCPSFLNKSVDQRLKDVVTFKLCDNCLRQGHNRSNCRSSGRCRVCQKRHHSLIHVPSETSNTTLTHPTGTHLNQHTTLCLSGDVRPTSYVFLATATINAIDSRKGLIPCRAILDSASQLNFVTEDLAQQLGLRKKRTSLSVSGIGGGNNLEVKHQTQLMLKSRLSDHSFKINAIMVPVITSYQPSSHINIESWSIPKNIELADPKFNEPQRIDILIGAELHFHLLESGQIFLDPELPILQKTLLGWIVSGKGAFTSPSDYSHHVAINSCHSDPLLDQVARFWELENYMPARSFQTKEDQKCEGHFQEHYRRDSSGRFVVRLPFKQSPSCLGDSFEMAKNRFLSLERRLHKNSDLLLHYTQFMKEYRSLNHMTSVNLNNLPEVNYFLPHHCILKPDSSTTKLRVVFDASAKSTSDYSLNDVLMVGPVVQEDLFSIILRFRTHLFVITADITKMYRQIQIDKNDQHFQNIIWRDHPEHPLQVYQLTTVTYGTASAPYLATRCLQQLATDEAPNFPKASAVVKRDFFVDDLITGGDSIMSVLELRNELTSLLHKGGFELQKWCSNDLQLLGGIPTDRKEKYLKFNHSEAIKTLGLIWQPQQDEFQFHTNLSEVKTTLTKRVILSDISKIFDPLGLINPVVLLGKLFMQQLWRLNLSWDEPLPMDYHTKWSQFRSQLGNINNVTFPRRVKSFGASVIQLHAFSDASQSAYGTCVYLRSTDNLGKISCVLLCAKSRVAPLKQTTLPRLELCAAVLMTQLVQRIIPSLNLTLDKIYYWTDSNIVLSWLQEPSANWETFIGNRVAVIQESTDINLWHHINTKQNPADLVSRGSFPDKLEQSKIWFHGPSFLSDPEKFWPFNQNFHPVLDIPGRRKAKHVLLAIDNHADLVEASKFKNSFIKLVNVFAYIHRFVKNCKLSPSDRRSNILSPSERDIARKSIIRLIQKLNFPQEYTALRKGEALYKHSRIQDLCPFLDDEGIIRVGGRLKNSELSYDAKHPMLLPPKHTFTRTLLTYLHVKHFHAGPQTLLNITRQKYWPLNGKNIAKKVVHSCIRCFRTKPRDISQLMGDLPSHRVQMARPFLHVGVDLCGPVQIHFKIRGRSAVKAYIVIFICFTTKAVHLELASDLSTNAFIAALKRFIGRRGMCANIYCDNATNFVGANRELTELREAFNSESHRGQIVEWCSQDNINFHFIPPRSPHFGGLWESAVKLTKHHLRRVVQGCSVTYEELNTVCIQIEAILNSRPISAISNDPNDLTPLTPGHFLIGEPLTSIAEPHLMDKNINLTSRWQRIQHIQQQFWNRWRTDYLNQLQTRKKWRTPSANINIGELVLLKEDNAPPMKWLLARVIELVPGKDGIVRVVTLKTINGLCKRSIAKICPLPNSVLEKLN